MAGRSWPGGNRAKESGVKGGGLQREKQAEAGTGVDEQGARKKARDLEGDDGRSFRGPTRHHGRVRRARPWWNEEKWGPQNAEASDCFDQLVDQLQ